MQTMIPNIRQIQQWNDDLKKDIVSAKPTNLFDLGTWADMHGIREQCHLILNDMPIHHLQIHNIRFYLAQFHGAHFSGCDFKNVIFFQCDLDKVIFENNRFENCTFENCQLLETSIHENNDMQGSFTFKLCQLSKTTMENRIASYAGTVADRSVSFLPAGSQSLSRQIPGLITELQQFYETLYRGVSFAGLNLSRFESNCYPIDVCKYEILPYLTLRTYSESLFKNQNFDSCSFNQANLCKADFENSSLRYVSFKGTDLSGANLANTDLTDFVMDEHTVLKGTNFTAAIIQFKLDYLTKLLKHGLKLQGMILIDVPVSEEVKALLTKHQVIFEVDAIEDIHLKQQILRQLAYKKQKQEIKQLERKKKLVDEQQQRINNTIEDKTRTVYAELVRHLVEQGNTTLHYGFRVERLGLETIEQTIVTKLIKLIAVICLAGEGPKNLINKLMQEDILRPVNELPLYTAHIRACYPMFDRVDAEVLAKLKNYSTGYVLNNTQRDQLFYFVKSLQFLSSGNTLILRFNFDEIKLKQNNKNLVEVQHEIIQVFNALKLFPASDKESDVFSLKVISQNNLATILEEEYQWYSEFWTTSLEQITQADSCYDWALRYYYKYYPLTHYANVHACLERALQLDPAHANALQLMGMLYEQGRGCEKNHERANDYFIRSQQYSSAKKSVEENKLTPTGSISEEKSETPVTSRPTISQSLGQYSVFKDNNRISVTSEPQDPTVTDSGSSDSVPELPSSDDESEASDVTQHSNSSFF